MDNGLEGNGYLVWCSVFYILWGMTYTIMDIPYWSLVPALTDDEDERIQISAIPRIFASCAWLVINSFGLLMVSKLGGGDDVKGFSILASIISIVFILASLVTVLTCKEQVVTKNAEKTSVIILNMWQSAPLREIRTACCIRFMLVFITVILSEVVDYGEYKLGTRNESILFSMQTFVVKFAGAFSGFVSGIGLTAIGYVANQQQTPEFYSKMRAELHARKEK